MMKVKDRYLYWIENVDDTTANELRTIENNEEEIHDRFYKNLEFGTGGMRGVLGAGPNRINRYTIAKATKGFAEYIKECGTVACDRGIIIAYDNRRMSRELAEVTAGVLAFNGIKAFLFEDIRSTPELSFAVRFLECFGGVVITASHNPPEYNGYKLYDESGCQFTPRFADKVTEYINNIDDEFSVELLSINAAGSLIEIVGNEIDEAYYKEVLSLQLNGDLNKDIKVIYSPQHGTGNIPVREVLGRAGYNVIPVLSQCVPDSEFSNTKNPNPEMPEAYEEAIKLMQLHNADIAIATDPDCDRLGAVINCGNGKYEMLTGNQSGAIILYYLLSNMESVGILPQNGVMFNTIVTSVFGDKIAESFGIGIEKTLTGFKFIGDKIKQHEVKGDKKFVFGYEESYGCLIGDFVRDKDAVQASLMFCEAANYYKAQRKTLFDVLEELFGKYGYFLDKLTSITLKGEEGAKKISEILDKLRNNPIASIVDIKVKKITDYLRNPPKEFIPANVIVYDFEDGSFVAIRPSGTEPKCKIYYCICGKDFQEANNKLASMQDFFERY